MHDVLKSMRIDLEMRGLKTNTVTTYLRYAGQFVRDVGKPLEQIDRDDVREYLLSLRAQGKRAPTRNMALAAVRFLFSTTLRRPEVVAGIRRARTQPTVPTILSGSEMAQTSSSVREGCMSSCDAFFATTAFRPVSHANAPASSTGSTAPGSMAASTASA